VTFRTKLAKLSSEQVSDLEPLLKTPTPSFINQLVLLVADDDPQIQIRATWLLKRLAEEKATFKTAHLIAVFDSVSTLVHWEARLHICQMLQHITIPTGCEKKLAGFLARCADEDNRFVRAWAYSGFYELAKQHPKYREYAMEQLDRGDSEKSAAVKARIRNIRKAMKESC
jgi:hypothetical protein